MSVKKQARNSGRFWAYALIAVGVICIAMSQYISGIEEAVLTSEGVAVPSNIWNVSIHGAPVRTRSFNIYNGRFTKVTLRIVPSCGCFNVYPTNITIPPMGCGTFFARIEPPRMTKDVSVLLTTSDGSRTALPSLTRIVEIKFQR